MATKRLHPEVRKWLRAKQSKGGQSRSPAKVEAARKNGIKARQAITRQATEADPD